MELHKLIMYVIEDEFTEHHYEHVECPERFTMKKSKKFQKNIQLT